MSQERNRNIHEVSYRAPQKEGFKTFPHDWSTMLGILKKEFENDPRLLEYLRTNRAYFMGFFRARLDIATQQGSEKFNRWRAKYDNPDSKFYDEERFEIGKPIVAKINGVLFPPRPLSQQLGFRR